MLEASILTLTNLFINNKVGTRDRFGSHKFAEQENKAADY